MSTPFLSIQCTSCAFSGSSLATFGQFLWKHEGQVFRMDREMGLCQNCNEIVAMEHFPEPEVLDRAKELHTEYRAKVTTILENDEAKYIASQEGIGVLEKIISLNRSPICLTCGGNDVQPIKIPRGVSIKTKTPVCLGISHPECGGLLMIKGSEGLRIGIRPTKSVYDIYGRLIMTVSE